jgi:hypothetical protein
LHLQPTISLIECYTYSPLAQQVEH